jgi:acetyl esterase/lipase
VTQQVHPDLLEAARRSPSFTMTSGKLWLVRLAMRFLRLPKLPADILVENRRIPGRDGRRRIRLRLYRPRETAAPIPVLLWFHGGGYVIGRPEMDEQVCARYARDLGIAVASVDYRLAPGQPYPAGLEDGYAALAWLHAQGGELGIDGRRIAIGGASAGGGLAAALVQMTHDRGEITPVCQLLVYPMLDDRTGRGADPDETDHLAWNRASNRFAWAAYLGMADRAPELPGYAVPARRRDLSGLPPAWIGVGTLDLFHDEDIAYAQGLRASGVDCEMLVVPGAFHGFDVFSPEAPIVDAFRTSQIAALKRHIFPSA